MLTERLKFLIGLYFDKTINESQQLELSQWVANHASDEDLKELLEQAWYDHRENSKMPGAASDKLISTILNSAFSPNFKATSNKTIFSNAKVIWLKRLAVAASILLIFSVGYLILRPEVSSVSIVRNTNQTEDNDIRPGGQKATLTLSDGSRIILDSAGNGLLTKQGSANVVKLANGELQYISNQITSSEIIYNTMTTPVGGQYQLVLPDGSKVWLNSASSIRYPTTFVEKERKVEITGEVYFEVAKNAKQPFKVKINLQAGEGGEVEVLGTHFNINAYDDEAIVSTTLFEGSVKVNNSIGSAQIKPGQQLQSDKQGQNKVINDTDLEEVIAWKEGRFQFENADIHSVMRQLTRWYDINVEYKGNITPHFEGAISRNVNILKVLEMLELTGEVNFKVEGRKVSVMRGKN